MNPGQQVTAETDVDGDAKSILLSVAQPGPSGPLVTKARLTPSEAHDLGQRLLTLAEQAGAEPSLDGFMGHDTHRDASAPVGAEK
jgi:hypothetical protein